MDLYLELGLTGVFAYIYGSIPFALVFTYLVKGELLYEKGSTNIGVANAFMVGGLVPGLLAVTGELTKVLLPILLTRYYFEGDLAISVLFIFCSLIGANFSIFLKGKGGRGTNVLMWSLLFLAPLSALLLMVSWIVWFKIIKDSTKASAVNALFIPVWIFLAGGELPLVVFGMATAALLLLTRKRIKDDISHFGITKRLKLEAEAPQVADQGSHGWHALSIQFAPQFARHAGR